MNDAAQAAATEQTTVDAHDETLKNHAQQHQGGEIDHQEFLAHVASVVASAHAAGGEAAEKLAGWLSAQFHK